MEGFSGGCPGPCPGVSGGLCAAPSGAPGPCGPPGGIIPGGNGGIPCCIIRFSIGTTGRRMMGCWGGRVTWMTWQMAMVTRLNAASAMQTFT